MQMIVLLMLLLAAASSHAEPALQPVTENAWAFTFENDVFAGSDDNYTDGIQLECSRRGKLASQDEKSLLRSLCRHFGCNADAPVTTRQRFGQLMYTPTDIGNPAPQPNDRPWAGMLYYQRSHALPVGEERSVAFAGMVGIIGPNSLARQAQTFIHRHITPSSVDPQGWHNQVGSALGLMLTVEDRRVLRNFPERPLHGGVGLNTSWYWRAAVGNIMSYAGVGAAFELGKNLPALSSAEPGTVPEKRLDGDSSCVFSWMQCTLFGSVELRAMAFNVFLDGNPGRGDPQVNSRPLVGDASLGLRLAFPHKRGGGIGPYFVQFKATQRSAEFRSSAQAGSQKWAALTFGRLF